MPMPHPNDRSSIARLPYLDSAQQRLITTIATMWQQVKDFVRNIPDLLVPKVVRVEIPLDKQLSDAIAQSLHDPAFRIQLLAHSRQALSSLGIEIPPQQQVTVLESTSTQTFLILPIMTDREIEHLQAGVSSQRSMRSVRSRIILKTWQDPDYKARLCTDPKAVLIAEGVKIPDLATVKVLENSSEYLYLVIPAIH
jgi:Nitrile hydratase, alpha chain